MPLAMNESKVISSLSQNSAASPLSSMLMKMGKKAQVWGVMGLLNMAEAPTSSKHSGHSSNTFFKAWVTRG